MHDMKNTRKHEYIQGEGTHRKEHEEGPIDIAAEFIDFPNDKISTVFSPSAHKQ